MADSSNAASVRTTHQAWSNRTRKADGNAAAHSWTVFANTGVTIAWTGHRTYFAGGVSISARAALTVSRNPFSRYMPATRAHPSNPVENTPRITTTRTSVGIRFWRQACHLC